MRVAPAVVVPLAAVAALAVAAPAAADPTTLRLATIAPAGSGWAREFSAWARDVEAATDLHIKIYFDGIAGDDVAMLDRIRRDQLDGGIASEGCVRVAPSMRITRVFGLFQSREESKYVMSRLLPILEAESLKHGFVNLGEAELGPEVLFTRRPVHDFAELQKTRLWVWELDDALRTQARALGLDVVPTPLDQAARAYDDGRVDGFIAMPTAALAFQWSAQARYLEPLALSYRNGCMLFSTRTFDALPLDTQQYIRAAAGKLRGRLDDLSRRQDAALLGGLFARQGLKAVPVGERFRLEFFSRAQELRARSGAELVPPELMQKVLGWLADYRGEHDAAR